MLRPEPLAEPPAVSRPPVWPAGPASSAPKGRRSRDGSTFYWPPSTPVHPTCGVVLRGSSFEFLDSQTLSTIGEEMVLSRHGSWAGHQTWVDTLRNLEAELSASTIDRASIPRLAVEEDAIVVTEAGIVAFHLKVLDLALSCFHTRYRKLIFIR